jgi:phage terminase small subunit
MKSSKPPDNLSEPAKKLWRDLSPECASAGRRMLLEQLLRAYDRAEAARAKIEDAGLTVTTERSGVVHVHPLLKIERESRALLVRLAATLNLQFP